MLNTLAKQLSEKLTLRVLRSDEMESVKLREYFSAHFGVTVGLYSYGCFDPRRFPPKTNIGRYCSFASTSRIVLNHPAKSISSHPIFYLPSLGVSAEASDLPVSTTIEDDVWVGHNVTITSGCRFIGRGAVIGAGAVVTKDVPTYSVMAGVPASVVRKRYAPNVADAINLSKWWELDKKALKLALNVHPEAFRNPSVDTVEKLKYYIDNLRVLADGSYS